MKQVIQNVKSGEIRLEEVAVPRLRTGHVLIRTTRTLISAGTERMVVEFGRAGYFAKATQQPERLKVLLDKVRTDGVMPAVEAVGAKLAQPMVLGYCNVGRVLEVGDGVGHLRPGDRVASNGRHAEVVLVPANLCAKIPDEVSDEAASFTVVGSIALQGVRLVEPTLGESVAVFGLGLIGLLAAQLLKLNGARVLGFDTDPERVELARSYGIEAVDLSSGADPVASGIEFSDGSGIDGVLITASSESHDIVHQAAEMSRKRGRIVLTGVVGLNLRRSDFYEKELRFQVSCSYGPGRYDTSYEEHGNDYPLGFVRWTERRNFETILSLLEGGGLRVDELVSARHPVTHAEQAYDGISARKVIGSVLEYAEVADADEVAPVRVVANPEVQSGRDRTAGTVCAVIGSGSFAQARILPALKETVARLKWIASSEGVSGAVSARRFAAEQSTTDVGAILSDPEVNLVVIATRHDTHASLTTAALDAGKSVFVEKPLCLNRSELAAVKRSYDAATKQGPSRPILMVGYNRRFAPLVLELKRSLPRRGGPIAVTYLCNAGAAARDSWVNDPKVGGGRIIGEACHFVDLVGSIISAPVTSVSAVSLGGATTDPGLADTVGMSLSYADGSIAQIQYFANGSKRFPKETMTVFASGRVLRLENFRRLRGFGTQGRLGKYSLTQDKGHQAEFTALVEAIDGGRESPTPFVDLVQTSEIVFAALDSLAHGQTIRIG